MNTKTSTTPNPSIPLAERFRPRALDEVIGQTHLLEAGKPLRLVFETGIPHSMILSGPPGVGKTTLARLIARACQAEYIELSAVFSGIKDIRSAIEQAEYHRSQQRSSILFIDEIHRFNKAQQDALLPHVESGLVTLIGATTENPSFEVNAALLSRAQVYVLQALKDEELLQLAKHIVATLLSNQPIEEEALQIMVQYADGDARRLLNLIEQVHVALQASNPSPETITATWVEHALNKNAKRFDKSGDQFYDQISALHKAVRGSSPDAALYWLCRMLEGGADPHYLARRLIRMAWEDIGLADPRAADITLQAAATYERLGSPEGDLALAQAVLYLAVAAKSNAGYKAYKEAVAFVKKDRFRPVPIHLRNAPTQWMKEQGYGHQYRYTHDEPHGYAAGESYFPEGIQPTWYTPVARGLETKIGEKLAWLKKLDQEEKAR